jgi:hypothetical protein
MRRDSKTDPRKAKQIARQKYAERQIDKYINWSIEQRGWVKYKDILEIQNKYNIKCYGQDNNV